SAWPAVENDWRGRFFSASRCGACRVGRVFEAHRVLWWASKTRPTLPCWPAVDLKSWHQPAAVDAHRSAEVAGALPLHLEAIPGLEPGEAVLPLGRVGGNHLDGLPGLFGGAAQHHLEDPDPVPGVLLQNPRDQKFLVLVFGVGGLLVAGVVLGQPGGADP